MVEESKNEENNIKIDKPPHLKINTRTLLISKSGSGKSVLLKQLLYNLLNDYEIHQVFLFSETALFEDEYNFIPKKCIMEYDAKKIKKIFEYQQKNHKKNKPAKNSDTDKARC